MTKYKKEFFRCLNSELQSHFSITRPIGFMNRFFSLFRLRLLAALFAITPIGFATKFYTGPFRTWVADSLGGILYEVFWCLAGLFIFQNASSKKVAVWVFGITCLLECMQLWHPPFLETIRSTFIGRTLIGTSFAWLDFPHYAVGSLLGWHLVNSLRPRTNSK